jgi:hypothetical protein
VLSPTQREIVYRTIVRREVYPQPDVRSAYPPVVARTDVIEPSPRSYPLRSIRPFPNDNAYETYTAPRYDNGYINNGYVPDRYYNRYPARAAYVVGARVPESVPLVAVPENVALQVPAARPYSYAVIGDRVYLVDPTTGVIVADVTQ